LRVAQDRQQQAGKAESDARAAGARAAISERKAEAAEKKFNDKIERLQSALRAM